MTIARNAKPVLVLLEDDWRIAGMVVEYFETEAYDVRRTADAASAAAAIEAVNGAAILIADRSIGAGPNGFTVAHDALARYPALKVIYISSTHTALRHRVLSDRESVLPKPFAMAQLLTAVKAFEA